MARRKRSGANYRGLPVRLRPSWRYGDVMQAALYYSRRGRWLLVDDSDGPSGDRILTEGSDYILMETGDYILME